MLISLTARQHQSFSPLVEGKAPVRPGRVQIVTIRQVDPALRHGPESPTVPCPTEQPRIIHVDASVGGFKPLPVVSRLLSGLKR